MKVLCVGGAGYVGGAVTDALDAKGHQASVYDSLVYEDEYRKLTPFVFGDVRDREKLEGELSKADAVVWLAAIVGDGACALNPRLSMEVNADAVAFLAEKFAGRVIFTSTASVYGAQGGVLDENAATGPLSVYGLTKLAAEKNLEGRDAVVFRLGTLFGVGDRYSRIRFDLVVNTLTLRAFQGKMLVCGGQQFRPLLHVKDAARAIATAVGSEERGTFNLCRYNVRVADLAYQVRNHFPDAVMETRDEGFENTRNYRIDSTKAEEELKLGAYAYSIDDGIEEIATILGEKRVKDPEAPKYRNEMAVRSAMG